MKRHSSDYILDDIIGGFRIFVISAILIYVALAIVNALYPTFPIKGDSWWIVSIIAALLISLFNYIKEKNKNYYNN